MIWIAYVGGSFILKELEMVVAISMNKDTTS